ncbi:MAG: hypothetical protein EOO04_29010 [Chitinophagaceae bacterium]|nr:MAG: hypothetical protein EOO04_29010 [Chitinophagaceae bacterium]
MKAVQNLAAGFAGAIALNILHESLKHLKGTPRIDRVGEEALQKSLSTVNAEITGDKNLYLATLGADVISNTIYYAAIGVGSPDQIFTRAITLGLTAGAGAVELPSLMGLNDKPIAASTSKKTLTVGYYLFGALVTAGVLKLMQRSGK